jgi:predicted NAD/FAD-binding protein
MNILQRLSSRHTFCVTLNDEDRIDPGKILRRFVYHHPVFTTTRRAVQARHGELLDSNRSSFCGAYWGNGFHEDGVTSALAVCRLLETRVSGAPQGRLVPATVGVGA